MRNTVWVPIAYIGDGWFFQQEWHLSIKEQYYGDYAELKGPVVSTQKSKRHEGAHTETIDSWSLNYRLCHISDIDGVSFENIDTESLE